MNTETIKKTAAFLLVTAIFFSFSLPAYGVEASYPVGGAYKKSKYYDRLSDVLMTGDERYDVISVAISQLGYHEGNSDSEMHGENKFGSKNFTEYNRIFGSPIDNGEGNGVSYGFEWCAAFVSWCQRQARVPSSSVITEISCIRLLEWLRSNESYIARSTGYEPRCADLIFFRPSSSSSRASHVGLVVGTDELYVYTIEGNNGGEVNYHKYRKNNSLILGYGVPKYETRSDVSYDFSLQESYFEPGVYITTADLNLRRGPSTSFASLLKIPKGTELTIVEAEGDWAKISYNGVSGFCSIDYLLQTDIMRYTVIYDANGGESAPESQKKDHSIGLSLSNELPVREGYVFRGWSSDKNSDFAELSPGDTYRANESVKLYAVWEYVGYTVRFYDGDGNLIASRKYDLGDVLELPEPPQKNGGLLFVYEFLGWSPEPAKTVLGDASYTATYEKKFVFTNTESTESTDTPSNPEAGGSTGGYQSSEKPPKSIDVASFFAGMIASAVAFAGAFILRKKL